MSVGHCCHDKIGDDFVLGGTASYASLVAKQLQSRSSIITSIGQDFLYNEEFKQYGIDLMVIPDLKTTVFENIYLPEGRDQYIHHKAANISKDKISANHDDVDILLLCPIADEVNINVVDLFPSSLKGASIQGWLRTWGNDKKIKSVEMDWALLAALDIVIISEEDIGYSKSKLEHIVDAVSHVVLTDGVNGATVFYEQQKIKLPAFPVVEVEATGAGDVFTTAYLHHFHETGSIEKSCIFAHCAASFIVEGIGIKNLPTEHKIRERMENYIFNV